jgi:hypothetical protein
MSTIEYRFRIGKETFSVELHAKERDDGTAVFSADDLLREQWKLGKKMVEEGADADGVSCEMFNFLADISGMTNSEIAAYINLEPATISQWRRHKGISKAAWQAFRIFFYDLFSNGSITNPILLGNRQKLAG